MKTGKFGGWDMFGKLDDAVKVIVDATFGWSNTLQENHLEKIRTQNTKDLLETEKELEKEKIRLEAEIAEREAHYIRKIEEEQNEEKCKIMKLEKELSQQDLKFKVDMVGKITKIVSGLQNAHSRKVMNLLTAYKSQQIGLIKELKESHKDNMREITEESKEFRNSYPEIYEIKINQLSSELASHQKLLLDITDGMNSDLQNIQSWLLDSSRFNAEEFVLKISGSAEEAKKFQKFIDHNSINVNQLIEEPVEKP